MLGQQYAPLGIMTWTDGEVTPTMEIAPRHERIVPVYRFRGRIVFNDEVHRGVEVIRWCLADFHQNPERVASMTLRRASSPSGVRPSHILSMS